MSIKRFTDWEGYWIGLRQNILKCIGTTGSAWLGTNAAAASGIPIPGIDWKQACVMFAVHVGFEIFTYLKDNQPKVTEINEETQIIQKQISTETQQK